jgi:valyl-tRNA synthetase
MRVGRRLAIKVLNASRLRWRPREPQGRSPAGRLRDAAELAALVSEATAAFEDYDYARVLQRTETFFWRFCDDYSSS